MLDGERTRERSVKICYLNSADIAEVMVRQGLARNCPRDSGGRMLTEEAAAAHGAAIRSTYR